MMGVSVEESEGYFSYEEAMEYLDFSLITENPEHALKSRT